MGEAPKKTPAQQVAEKLIEQIEKGTAPWQKPWEPGSVRFPVNASTGKRYRGVNVATLLGEDYADHRWLTYKQAKAMGGQVRKGSAGTPVMYYVFEERQEKLRTDDEGKLVMGEDGRPERVIGPDNKPVMETVRLERPKCVVSWVFNVSQIEGLDLPPLEKNAPEPTELDKRVAELVEKTGAKVFYDQNDRAYYSRIHDEIHMPQLKQFSDTYAHARTLLHEKAHWTGHETRLNREHSWAAKSKELQRELYAREELRAEIASLMLAGEYGCGHVPHSAAYVESWLKALKDDPREIFRAANDAEKIVQGITGLERGLTPEQAFGRTAQAPAREEGQAKEEKGRDEAPTPEQGKAAKRMTIPKADRYYLNVPYGEHKDAKALGARWEPNEKKWYCHKDDVATFKRWDAKAKEMEPKAPAVSPEMRAKFEAITAALKKGQTLQVATYTHIFQINKPEHVRLTKDGEMQMARGQGKWVYLIPEQVDQLARQAGMALESAESRFEKMVQEAARWQGATMHMAKSLADDPKAALKLSQMTTKGDLDAYLMKKFGIDAAEARSVSNTLTARNIPADMSADLKDFAKEPWAGITKEIAKPEQGPAQEGGAKQFITISPDDIPKRLAHDAHSLTSHVPDQRALQEQQGYVKDMQGIVDRLSQKIVPGQEQQLKDELERFQAGYLNRYKAVLASRSRVASPMITGRSNFPVRQQEKRSRSYENRLKDFTEWRERALKGMEKRLGLGPQSQAIRSDSKSALEEIKAEIAKRQERQEHMKAVNKEYTRVKGDVDAMNVDDKTKAAVKKWHENKAARMSDKPFASFTLSNNNAQIRRLKDRLAAVEKQQEKPASEKFFAGGRLLNNQDIGRTQIVFDGKPEKPVIEDLKKNGFRWAPSEGAWQRLNTNAAEYAAKALVERHYGPLQAEIAQPEPERAVATESPVLEGHRLRDSSREYRDRRSQFKLATYASTQGDHRAFETAKPEYDLARDGFIKAVSAAQAEHGSGYVKDQLVKTVGEQNARTFLEEIGFKEFKTPPVEIAKEDRVYIAGGLMPREIAEKAGAFYDPDKHEYYAHSQVAEEVLSRIREARKDVTFYQKADQGQVNAMEPEKTTLEAPGHEPDARDVAAFGVSFTRISNTVEELTTARQELTKAIKDYQKGMALDPNRMSPENQANLKAMSEARSRVEGLQKNLAEFSREADRSFGPGQAEAAIREAGGKDASRVLSEMRKADQQQALGR